MIIETAFSLMICSAPLKCQPIPTQIFDTLPLCENVMKDFNSNMVDKSKHYECWTYTPIRKN